MFSLFVNDLMKTCFQCVALCHFLENNQQQVNLMDKAVLEIGAGTGLLSIVASLLGKIKKSRPMTSVMK